MAAPNAPSSSSCVVQIFDHDGTVVNVTPEMLQAVGISADSLPLSQEQADQILQVLHQSTEVASLEELEEEEVLLEESGAVTIAPDKCGGLRLTDSTGKHFYFSTAQLNAVGINPNELNDGAIAKLVEMAIPNGAVMTQSSVPRQPQPRLPLPEKPKRLVAEPLRTDFAKGITRYSNGATADIGQSVQFMQNGKSLKGTVKFIRLHAAYKVQLPNGNFEWVDESDVVQTEADKTPNDHSSYFTQPSSSSSSANARASLKRPAPRSPNKTCFECPVCLKKSMQSRPPSYIIIKIPACDECSAEKVMVLEDVRSTPKI